MTPCPPDDFHLVPIARDRKVATLQPEMLDMTRDFYDRHGYNPPWIGYLSVQGREPVGGCAFVGTPRVKVVEIAYFTLASLQGKGLAAPAARELIGIAHRHDAGLTIAAKTLPQPTASSRALERLGCERAGWALDDDIGEAWYWTLCAG
jgi:RimJ/RimL family protein N-acetyltransferase